MQGQEAAEEERGQASKGQATSISGCSAYHPSSSTTPIQLDAETSPARVVMSSHEGLDDEDSPAKGTGITEESAPAKGDDNTATGEATANDPVVETAAAGTADAVPASASAETSGSKPSGSEPLKNLSADVPQR
jgi:hypothetical protein